MTPEQDARANIDRLLEQAGWSVQNADSLNLYASSGVAVREFSLKPGHGAADYLLYVDRKAVGVVEAKPEGFTLTGVEVQSAKYSVGLPDNLAAHQRPLPFLYESTGAETQFTNRLDPEPRSRGVFSFHTPKTLAEWIGATDTPDAEAHQMAARRGDYLTAHNLRQRLKTMPPLNASGLWPVQETAIRNLEESLGAGRPRALVQMATGSGKTFMACNQVYRLVKHAGARRVLFLVDRSNLGRQSLREFQGFTTPDEGPQVHGAVQRPTTPIFAYRPSKQGLHRHHTAGLLDPEGRGTRPGARGVFRLRQARAPTRACSSRIQPRRSDRDVRCHHHRRMSPLDLQPVAAGAGVL